MIFERGEVVLVPFPFTDLSAAKRRPVVVLTSPDGFGDFIAMPVTSRPHHRYGVVLSVSDITSGGLPTTSWIRTDRVVTLNASCVVKSIARLQAAAVATVVQQLCRYMGLASEPARSPPDARCR